MSGLPLVMLPGLDGTGRLFGPLLPGLAGAFRTQVIPYPPDDPNLGYQEIVDRVVGALPVAEPFVILGESFSGPVAAMLAARRPPGLVGIVMVVSFLHRPVRWHGMARTFSGVLRLHRIGAHRPVGAPRRLGWIDAAFGKAGQRLVEPILLGSKPDPAARQVLRQASAEVHPDVLARRAAATLSIDVRGDFMKIDVPILAIEAENDLLIRSDAGAEMKALRPEIEVARIAGPHVLLASRPKACAHALAAWASCFITV